MQEDSDNNDVLDTDNQNALCIKFLLQTNSLSASRLSSYAPIYINMGLEFSIKCPFCIFWNQTLKRLRGLRLIHLWSEPGRSLCLIPGGPGLKSLKHGTARHALEVSTASPSRGHKSFHSECQRTKHHPSKSVQVKTRVSGDLKRKEEEKP